MLGAGEGPCLATFFVKRYWQLLLLRIMTGISVGGTFPLVFSLVGDLFYVTQRANVAAGVQVATGVGFAAGQAIAGFVGVSTRFPVLHPCSCAFIRTARAHFLRCSMWCFFISLRASCL